MKNNRKATEIAQEKAQRIKPTKKVDLPRYSENVKNYRKFRIKHKLSPTKGLKS